MVTGTDGGGEELFFVHQPDAGPLQRKETRQHPDTSRSLVGVFAVGICNKNPFMVTRKGKVENIPRRLSV